MTSIRLMGLVASLAAALAAAVMAQAPASQPAAIDKLLDDLAKVEPKALAERLTAVQAQIKKLSEESAAMKARAAQNDAEIARLAAQVGLLEALVKARSMPPATMPAAATQPAPAMAAAPAAPKPPASAPAMAATAPAGAPAKPVINYADHILPIINEKCAGCHNPDKSRGGLNLVTYNDLMQGGSSGKVVEPGSPDASRLYKLVTHKEEPFMPPMQSKLDDARLELIRQWIEAGALPDAKAKPMAAKPQASGQPQAAVKTDLDAGPMPAGLPKAPLKKPPHAPAATALAASPNADLFAVAGDGQIHFYRTSTREWLGLIDYPEGRVERLAFSQDGSWLVAAGGQPGKSGTVIVLDVESGARKGVFDKLYDTVLAAAVSPDNGLIAVGGTNAKVRVFNAYDGARAYELTAHNDWIQAVEFSPDGTLLATGDRAGGLYVWEADTGREVHNLRAHTGAVTAVSFRADSQVLASTGRDGTVRLWEMSDGRQSRQWQAHGTASLWVEFAPDGRLATCGADGLARIWDQAGKNLRDLPNQGDWLYQAVFTPDAKSLITGGFNGAVALFEAESGKLLGTLSTVPQVN